MNEQNEIYWEGWPRLIIALFLCEFLVFMIRISFINRLSSHSIRAAACDSVFFAWIISTSLGRRKKKKMCVWKTSPYFFIVIRLRYLISSFFFESFLIELLCSRFEKNGEKNTTTCDNTYARLAESAECASLQITLVTLTSVSAMIWREWASMSTVELTRPAITFVLCVQISQRHVR